jgi:CHAT domain-containing protein
MPVQVNSSGWRVKRAGVSRGGVRTDAGPPGLPPEFLTPASRVADEIVLEPAQRTRGGDAGSDVIDLTCDVRPAHTAMLAVRLPSGALTFHRPLQTTTRAAFGPSTARFQVAVRRSAATRGFLGQVLKVIVIEIAKISADKALSLALPKLAAAYERATWKKRGLKEGWLRVTKKTLAAGVLEAARPVSPERSLLLVHGTFSNAAAGYRALADSAFFDRVAAAYSDRIFAFDHFSVSRTPEENARMLLEGLPEQTTTFDVVAHSRGGLVLRNLVERSMQFGPLGRRFKLGRAVLVASPNEGTPLATPKRWEETVGWIANILEILPDNPFTTGSAFVANGLVWLANHASGDLPGLHSMDGDGELIAAIQTPPGPPADAYSALVANYHPTGDTLRRLLDAGMDQFFGTANDLMVPSEGGWRVDRSTTSIPASRIACFGPGGNLPADSVTHVSFFSQPAAVDFLVNALLGQPQPLSRINPRTNLPDRRSSRGAPGPAGAAGKTRAAAREAGSRGEAPSPAPLRITVTNGDLTFEREVLLIGHYRSTRLTGTEAVMDRLIGGAMSHALRSGVYPSAVGSHQIFINNRPDLERGTFLPRPKAVVVVGLGEEGKLQAVNLASTVRQAVIAWAQRMAEDKKHPTRQFTLATTLIGSGGTGVSAGEAARLIAQGVTEANGILHDERGPDGAWPRVSHLHFIELYLERATDAWRSLRMQEASKPGQYDIVDRVLVGTGPLQRPPDSGYRGTNYDFVTIETKNEEGGEPKIAFTLDTRRARSEVRGQRAQSALIRDLVATASSDQNRDERLGHTLFNLLVPIELEAYLTGSGEMVIELDSGTARIPWELLDRDASEPPPWALRVKLLRKLRTARYRDQVTDADADDRVLIIGEPACPEQYPRLYGARREAEAVRSCLTGASGLDEALVRALISEDVSQTGADARTVLNAMFEQRWRIVHIAGHGMPPADGSAGGVVLSTGSFLGPDEIRNMRTVPELVFVNCCHLAGGDERQLLNYDRASFASGVAGALIEIGVRCVIAAGWAVDDDAASAFAEAFYSSLLRGNRFIDAVHEARKAAYENGQHVNTWAAYQCYGDPDWVFRQKPSDPNQFSPALLDDFSGIGSATSLRLALDRIIVQSKFQGADPATQVANLTKLEELFDAKWGDTGAVAELFGQAFVETGAVERGLRWYERAVAAADGRASMKASEQLANVRGRLAWEVVDQARRHRDQTRLRERRTGRSRKARAAARRARVSAEQSLRRAVVRADRLIQRALPMLVRLEGLEKTLERASLLGSVYKRRALVDEAVGRRGRMSASLRQMKRHYERAQAIGTESGAADVYYPASNRLAADVALNAGRRGWRGLDRAILPVIRTSLAAKRAHEADFWSIAGEIELRQYEALARRRLASAYPQLDKAYQDLHRRVAATRMWASVYDTACLVLPSYAGRVGGREKSTAKELLARLRAFAHPEEGSGHAD